MLVFIIGCTQKQAQTENKDSVKIAIHAKDSIATDTPNPMNATEVQALISAGLPGAQVSVQSDDDTHFAALIVAPREISMQRVHMCADDWSESERTDIVGGLLNMGLVAKHA